MRDELNKDRASTDDECLVLNTDHSDNVGTHWTCLFIKNGELGYFDPYGFAPPLEVLDYCKCKNRRYSSFEIQQHGEVICGHYCVYALYRLSRGHKFYDILDELVRRKKIIL
jgi:hypothetical protein